MALCVSIFLLIHGILSSAGSPSASSLFALSFGSISPETVIYWHLPAYGSAGFVANTLVANLPQVILSFAYLIYNSLFTSMLATYEWSQMAWQRKGLRVSHNPQGAQRSTYFLQLPYRYAIPLLIGSGTMHWLVSQSLFLVTVMRFDESGEPLGGSASSATRYSCGWSPVAVLCTVIGTVVMMAAGLLIGRCFHLRPGMPLNGTCTAVVAAACHADLTEMSDGIMATEKLKWGVVTGPSGDNADTTDTAVDFEELREEEQEELDNNGDFHSITKEPSLSYFPGTRNSLFPHNTAYEPVASGASLDVVPLTQIKRKAHAIGHCAFTAREPGFPQEGAQYS